MAIIASVLSLKIWAERDGNANHVICRRYKTTISAVAFIFNEHLYQQLLLKCPTEETVITNMTEVDRALLLVPMMIARCVAAFAPVFLSA